MSETPQLSYFYSRWLKTLESVDASARFDSPPSNEDLIEYVLELLENNPKKLFLDASGKNNNKSKSCREAGNQKYVGGQFDKALEYYTKSIAFAASDSQELILALGNRAACLLNLGYIAEALVDVQRALAIPFIAPGYKDKLISRQDVCINRIIESKQPSADKQLPVMSTRSEYFDSASGKVILADSPQLGRHLVAKDAVVTGEVLIIEKPYSSILLPECFYTHCSNCFLNAPSLVECQDCTTALYCSTDCLNKSKKCHALECKIMEQLVVLGLGKMDLLALRIFIDALHEGYDMSALLSNSSIPSSTEIYKSLDFIRVYGLIGNKEKRSHQDLLKRSFTACTIIQALSQFTTFFEDYQVTGTAAAAVIMHFLQSLPCNAHEITEMIKGEVVEIGAAAYATLSLLNHSCEPNAVRHSNGNAVVLRAIRPILSNEEIVDNYGYHYATHVKRDRQEPLLTQYYFQCQCQACSEDWPLYAQIPAKHLRLKLPEDPEATEQYLKMTSQFEEDLAHVLENRITPDVLDSLCAYLDFLEKYVKRPWQDFNKCQEAIKQALNFCHHFNRC